MAEGPLGREGFAGAFDVSRETLERLDAYLDLLRRWQRAINLVGRSTLEDPWRRHVLDCAQLLHHVPRETRTLVDLGSGAGFPGMVLAILGVAGVHLIERDRRKAAFLAEVARATATPVEIHAARIEDLQGWPADVVTARALAPLGALLALAERFVAPGSMCLFLKGASAGSELTQAAKCWHMTADMLPSLSDPSGTVLKLRDIHRAPRR